MIDQVNATATNSTYSLTLPKQITQTGVQGSVFGMIFSENAGQFATKETANSLASFLGAKVVDESSQWMGGTPGPLYGIQFSNGKLLNAGLLADRFNKYGVRSALQMTEAEIGGSIQIAAPAISSGNGSNPSVGISSPPAAASASVPAKSSSSIADFAPAVSNSLAQPVAASDAVVLAATNAAQVFSAAPASASVTGSATADPGKLVQAAKQFESLLVSQLLKSSTEGHEDGVFGSGSSESASLMEMAQEQFAQAISSQGGLGLADLIVRQVDPSSATPTIQS